MLLTPESDRCASFARLRIAFFLFFFLSGFCSLVYQVVWLRLGMAGFGVNAAIVSLVLSVFMAGLATGSWGAGAWLRRHGRSPAAALRVYACAELGIGLSAWIVPLALEVGGRWVGQVGAGSASASHFALSGAWLTIVLLPFCFAMGATLPLALRVLEAAGPDPDGETSSGPRPSHPSRSFSYLYAANVAGGALGTLLSAFVLIELFGFAGTLRFAAALNFLVAALALLALRGRASETPIAVEEELPRRASRGGAVLGALFLTGLVSMAAEVVWVRQYTPYLSTMVYAFAVLLAVYLVATFCGSLIYRSLPEASVARWERAAWIALPMFIALAALATDPRFSLAIGGSIPGLFRFEAVARLILGIAPFSAATGFITPLLVDRYSAGHPRAAGLAYAVNVVGCILGPLVAGFVLLPLLDERWVLTLLALPLAASAVALHRRWLATAATSMLAVVATVATHGFESTLPGATVRRDSTATVTAAGSGMSKRLLVNGIGMTHLTPITKMMAHLPLAFRTSKPTRGTLVICLGMGTTLRSALSWQSPATAVELVPSVAELAPYFHPDARQAFSAPGARVVVDDGRRFLARSTDLYDVIVVDPPPPVYAAGSSLLYSAEFYEVARPRLAPGGVLQQWIPAGDELLMSAIVAAVKENFRHVRLFSSIEGWGLHILASQERLEAETGEELAARLPPEAVADLLEWGPATTAAEQFRRVLETEVPLESLLRSDAESLRDDRPVNEYYFLRLKESLADGTREHN